MSALVSLEAVPLFSDLEPDDREHVAGLMSAFTVPAKSVLFREGDAGDRMYIVQSGLLQASRPALGNGEVALAQLGPGAVVGELSLLGAGTRTATVTAIEDTKGWALDRATFDVMRADLRPGSLAFMRNIGTLGLERLRNRYEAIGGVLGWTASRVERAELEVTTPEAGDAAYLRSTLFFRRMTEDEVASVVRDARRLHAPRGAVIVGAGRAVPALFIVARGAIETTIRGGGRSRRVRLAGPGRAVGHLGLLGKAESIAECRARERAILIEFSWDRVYTLRAATDAAARRFTAALDEDVVRALHEAERPLPPMVAS